MSNDLFRMSQQSGIYHTFSLWSRLSPRLSKGERIEANSSAREIPEVPKFDDHVSQEAPPDLSSND
jgi:hypothetical protein